MVNPVASIQAGELMGILLGALPRLGMNALLVRRMVSALASRAKGRTALRLGVAQWQRKAGGGSGADADAKAALQWAVSHLWQLSESLSWCRAAAATLWFSLHTDRLNCDSGPESAQASVQQSTAASVHCMLACHESYRRLIKMLWLSSCLLAFPRCSGSTI